MQSYCRICKGFVCRLYLFHCVMHSVLWLLNSKWADYIYYRSGEYSLPRKLASHKSELSSPFSVTLLSCVLLANFLICDSGLDVFCIVYFFIYAMLTSFNVGNGYKCVKRVQSKPKQSIQLCHCIFIPQRCVEHSNEKSRVVQKEQQTAHIETGTLEIHQIENECANEPNERAIITMCFVFANHTCSYATKR